MKKKGGVIKYFYKTLIILGLMNASFAQNITNCNEEAQERHDGKIVIQKTLQ